MRICLGAHSFVVSGYVCLAGYWYLPTENLSAGSGMRADVEERQFWGSLTPIGLVARSSRGMKLTSRS